MVKSQLLLKKTRVKKDALVKVKKTKRSKLPTLSSSPINLTDPPFHVPTVEEKIYSGGFDPGRREMGVSIRNVHTNETIIHNVDLEMWGGNEYAVMDCDYGILVHEFLSSLDVYMKDMGWFYIERQPLRVGRSKTDPRILMVMSHVEQYVRTKYPQIAFTYVQPRTVKHERGASASDKVERKNKVWMPKNNVMKPIDLERAKRIFINPNAKGGVKADRDAVEAAQLEAHGFRHRYDFKYHVMNPQRPFRIRSMKFIAIPNESQITKKE